MKAAFSNGDQLKVQKRCELVSRASAVLVMESSHLPT